MPIYRVCGFKSRLRHHRNRKATARSLFCSSGLLCASRCVGRAYTTSFCMVDLLIRAVHFISCVAWIEACSPLGPCRLKIRRIMRRHFFCMLAEWQRGALLSRRHLFMQGKNPISNRLAISLGETSYSHISSGGSSKKPSRFGKKFKKVLALSRSKG